MIYKLFRFQKTFTIKDIMKLNPFYRSNVKKPIPFLKIPYDEQYECRDFIRTNVIKNK